MPWRKRLVRLHLLDDQPSFEGILVGRAGGHYRLEAPKMLVSEEQTQTLDGTALVPCDRVLFVQVLGR